MRYYASQIVNIYGSRRGAKYFSHFILDIDNLITVILEEKIKIRFQFTYTLAVKYHHLGNNIH